jgi:esterase/lipase superfamily enzyme
MELVVHGHAGPRLLAFPTSMGWNREWEDRGMCDAVGELLAGGRLQVICVPSVDDRSWYDDAAHPRARVEWHARYDLYLRDEVLPHTAANNPDPFVITAGASFGGYHALSFATRYPDRIRRALVMSGLVDIRRLTGGWSDEVIYFYNPAEYLVHEYDPERMRQLQALDLIFAVGRDDPLRPQNEALSSLLWDRGIGNALRLWDGWAHDWPWWHDMLRRYVGGHD